MVKKIEKTLEIRIVNNKTDFDKVMEIRKNVFVEEQQVPLDIEMDGLDSHAEHVIAFLNGIPIGCGRIRRNKNIKLERVAIIKKFRSNGFGRRLMKFLIDYCMQNNYDEICIHSQTHVSGFYKKLGFKIRGATFFEAGIEHVDMYMKIH